MTFDFILLAFQALIVPAALILWLWRRQSKTKLDWLLRLSITGTYVVDMVLRAPWSRVSLHLRWIFLAALIAAAVISFGRARDTPFYMRNGVWWWLSLGGRALLMAIFVLWILLTFQARTYAGEALAIAAPLRGGRYVVDNGGSNPLLNYHSESGGPQTYALDISQASALGARAQGVLPRRLERYAIFGDTVYSPISGTVVAAVDGLPDLTPPEMDPSQPAGNHVWVRAGNVYLLLAHLKNGSVRVRPGEAVSAGESIGQVGNSGNTSEPHLHIHAVRIEGEVSPDKLLRLGEPVPLLIEGRFLSRNSTF
jgi:Peptidase family M23